MTHARAERNTYPSPPPTAINGSAPLPNLTVNLKQWRILHAVVACGSFANAATALGMSQPAISYTIAKMEDQLGVTLLRQEGRRAHLTEQGLALLDRARALLREAFDLEEYAESMRLGVGPQFRLAVDRDFPTRSLFAKLRNFTSLGRPVRVHLIEVGANSVMALLKSRSVDLAIADHIPAGLVGQPFAQAEYVMVAHPDHPLACLKRAIVQSDLDREMQVVVVSETDRAEQQRGSLTLAPQWRVSNFDTAETALLDGVGYGCMPRHRIEGLLRSGRLKQLHIANQEPRRATYYIVHARPLTTGSEAHQLAQLLSRDQ